MSQSDSNTSKAVQVTDLPWGPIYTVSRSGIPEISVQGIVYLWVEDRALHANAGHALLKIGQTNVPLWSRSLLKPFQLMVLYPTLKQAYPQLTVQHFALMLSSHSGDDAQLRLLGEILSVGGLQESELRCPACTAMNGQQPGKKNVLNHPCAGKHLAHLLYYKSQGLPLQGYLAPDQPPYQRLRQLLEFLLGRSDFEESVDGCGMPNFALSTVELAQLYHALVMPVSRDLIRQAPDELTECLSQWPVIASLMREHAALVGGQNRLDTGLMSAFSQAQIPLLAKEGADGLLAVGMGPNTIFKDGLGLLIKVASGYQPQQLTYIVMALFRQLGLLQEASALAALAGVLDDDILSTQFHFDVTGKHFAV